MKDVNILIKNGVDVKKALEILEDMETYDGILEDFLTEGEERITKAKTYKDALDMPSYAIQVHSLKSGARYLGFDKLADMAYKHELESKANNLSFISTHFEELVNETNRALRLVRQYFNPSVATPEPQVQAPQAQASASVTGNQEIGKAILIADDSNIISNFIKKVFSNDYEVLVANDGQEAINIIENSNENRIAALLLDLNMPNVDGFGVLDYFTEKNLFKQIPVSIITGYDTKDMTDRAFTYPIVDMLGKPFNEKDVKTIVERTVNYHEN